jgi:hypothetical protein
LEIYFIWDYILQSVASQQNLLLGKFVLALNLPRLLIQYIKVNIPELGSLIAFADAGKRRFLKIFLLLIFIAIFNAKFSSTDSSLSHSLFQSQSFFLLTLACCILAKCRVSLQ